MEYLVINVDCFMSSDKILDAQSYWNHRCRSVEISFYTFYITLFEWFQFLDVHNPVNLNLAHISRNGALQLSRKTPSICKSKMVFLAVTGKIWLLKFSVWLEFIGLIVKVITALMHGYYSHVGFISGSFLFENV